MPTSKLEYQNILLNGKLITADDPALIGNNFQSLKNMRYDTANPKGVGGMLKVNTTQLATTRRRISNGFHFKKEQPAETHVICQAYDTSEANPVLIKNTTAIPSQGDFSATNLFTDSSGGGIGRFSDAPQGQMAYCNGKDTKIWGGNESKVGAFIIYNPDGSIRKDYTKEVQNTLDDDLNVATLSTTGAGISSTTTMLMLNGNDIQTEKITTPGFTGGISPWTVTGNFAYGTNNVVKTTGATGTLTQTSANMATPLVTGEAYMLSFVISGSTSADTTTVTCGGVTVHNAVNFGNQTYTERFIATSTASLVFTATNLAVYTIDDVSLTKLVNDTSPTTPHIMTAVGNAATSATQSKFGGRSLYLDGTGDWLTTPHDVDLNLSDGTFTIDTWIWLDDVSSEHTICGSQTDTNRYWFFNVVGGASAGQLEFEAKFVPSSQWAGTTAYAVGDAVVKVGGGGLYYYECTTAGTSAGSEPTWVNTIGSTTNDNTVVWTTRGQINIDILTGSGRVAINEWVHVAVTENAGDFYLFINGHREGASTGNGATVRLSNIVPTTAVPTPLLYIGVQGNGSTTPFKGYMDELRISNTCLWTADFTPSVFEYSTSASGNIYIGSTRPLGGSDSNGVKQGIKFYVKNANDAAGTSSFVTWNGSSYVAVSNLTDGTVSGGIPLAITGVMGFDSTDGTSKVKVIAGIALYWYILNVTALNTATTVSQVTVYKPFQTVKDVWNGVWSKVLSFQIYADGGYNDHTSAVLNPTYEFLDSTTISGATVASLDVLTTSEFVIAGFSEQIMAINILLASSNVNTNACSVIVEYSDTGSSDTTIWTAVSGLEDGTSKDGKSLNKSGLISWNPPNSNAEFKTDIAIGEPLYNYRIRWTAQLSNNVKVNYVAGIPAPKTIGSYKFPFFADDSLWLCSEQSKRKNAVIKSAKYAPDVWNGDDIYEPDFGDEKELTSACVLPIINADYVGDIKLFFKENATYGVTGQRTEDYKKFTISTSVGNVAPLSLQTAVTNIGGGAKTVAIFQANDGIYISDGFNQLNVSGDIRNFFDERQGNTSKLHSSYRKNSTSFIDEKNMEYHWIFADGASTGVLNREFVLDLSKKEPRWFEVPRGTNYQLQCGFKVTDTNGLNYNYGAIDSGYLERLEFGNTMDGGDIAHEMWTGDIVPSDSFLVLSQLLSHKLVMKAKATTTSTVAITHYADTQTTGTSLTVADPTNANFRIADVIDKKTLPLIAGIFHSFKYGISTNDETSGFEPLAVAIKWNIIGEDKE